MPKSHQNIFLSIWKRITSSILVKCRQWCCPHKFGFRTYILLVDWIDLDMRVYILAKAFENLIDFCLFATLLNVLQRVICCFGSISIEIIFRNFLSFFKKAFFLKLCSVELICKSEGFGPSIDLLIDIGCCLRPITHSLLNVQVFKFILNLKLPIFQQPP